MPECIAVFVYGSLKRGFRHANVVQGARYAGPAAAEPFMLVRYGEYPALAAAAWGRVEGELLWVSQELLLELDAFEECPTLYQRAPIRLTSGQLAFAYVIDPALAQRYPRIEGGIWQERG